MAKRTKRYSLIGIDALPKKTLARRVCRKMSKKRLIPKGGIKECMKALVTLPQQELATQAWIMRSEKAKAKRPYGPKFFIPYPGDPWDRR